MPYRILTRLYAMFSLLLLATTAQATVILQYHHIDSSTPASTSTTAKLFAEHLQWLSESGYKVIPLTDLTQALRNKSPVPDKSVVITFDDAYTSIYDTAFPLLKKHNFPFTIFVNTGAVDAGQKRTLSWGQLREMADNGATLANHTVDHEHLVESRHDASKEAWIARIGNELDKAEQRIQAETDQNHRLLAWPFGETTPELEQLLAEKGYLGLGQQSGAVGAFSNPSKLPRYPMGASYGAMKNFPLKALSQPLPVTSYSPATSMAPQDGLIPSLTLELAEGNWASDRLACYGFGQSLPLKWLDESRTQLQVTLTRALPVGRSRINCTAPDTKSNRWFWFSHDWVRLTADGEALN